MIFNISDLSELISRVEYLESKSALRYFNLADYIELRNGFTLGADSFMRRSLDTIELYLVINGNFVGGTTPHVCTIKSLKPYATNIARSFPLILNTNGWSSNAYINVISGYVSAIIPSGMTESQVILNAVYTVSALQ